MKIGFIGLGLMGSRMAANLQKHGHDLVVFNRTKAKGDRLVAEGATWAGSPAEVARQAATVVTMVADPEALIEVAQGNDGLLEQLRPDGLWLDCSTVNPSCTRKMAAAARAVGARFVDAPVAGTIGPAEQAQLLFLAGGDDADVEACRPLFDAMGRGVIHVGGSGMGTSLKMVFNLLLAEAIVAFGEGLVLGQALGIPREKLLEILPGAPVAAPFVSGKQGKIESGEYSPEFPLKWMHKDLQLASISAYEQNLPLLAGSAVKEIFALAAADGLGEDDFSAICGFLEARRPSA